MAIPPIKNQPPQVVNIPRNKNERIEKIALEALKVLGLAVGGALLAGLTLASSGTIWLIAGAVMGAATAVGSYAAGKYFVHLQKKYAFPAHSICKQPPIPDDHYFSVKREKKFLEALKNKIQPLPEYAEWKKARGNISDSKARRLFWRAMHQERSAGEAYAMALNALSHTPGTDKEPFGHLHSETVFNRQMRSVLSADLKKDLDARGMSKKYNADQFPSLEDFSMQLNHPTVGTATFFRKNQKKTLFFQVTEKGGRFYDGSHRLAGFHVDTSTPSQFIGKLHMHLKAGLVGKKIFRTQYDAVEIEFF